MTLFFFKLPSFFFAIVSVACYNLNKSLIFGNRQFVREVFIMDLKVIKGLLILALSAVMLAGCALDEDEPVAAEAVAAEDAEASTEGESDFEGLDTVDLEGNSVTKDIFSQADVTVVNVWGTFCGPCIGEMPELQKWNEEKADNVQIIGIVADIGGAGDSEHIDLANQIGEKAGITFTNIIPDEYLYENLLSSINVVPTTFLVDKEGNIIPDSTIQGAQVEAYKEAVSSYLEGNS